MKASRRDSVSRRRFLRNAATGAAGAAIAAAGPALAQQVPAPPVAGPTATPPPRAAETGVPPELEVLTTGRPGADFMVDVVRSLGIEYVAANPGSSFRGLQ